MQSTKRPKKIDGIINLEAVLAYNSNGPITFTSGEVNPYNNNPELNWNKALKIGDGMMHTAGTAPPDTDEYLELRFDKSTPVSFVVVVNRSDAPWSDRLQNATLILFDGNKEVWRQDLGSSTQMVYVFQITK